jgi:branched-chain amino acid transport system permease protein
VGVLACSLSGCVYRVFVGALIRKGAREGQLLITSLAVMAIGENLATLFFGATSVSLWPFSAKDAVLTSPVVVTKQQMVYFAVGGCALTTTVLLWRRTLVGKAFQALEDSPLNLALRGYSVPFLERVSAAFGFALVGVAGLIWGINVRIKPAMCTEIGVAGAVMFISATMVANGPIGLIVAALILSCVRLVLSLTFEGDWNLSAMLVFLLLAVLTAKKARLPGERAP